MFLTSDKAKKILGDDLILEINPIKITRYTDPPYFYYTKRLRTNLLGKYISSLILLPYKQFVRSGSWDSHLRLFSECEAYQNMLDLYQHKSRFCESQWYKRAESMILSGQAFRYKKTSIRSKAELNEFFNDYLLQLLISMEEKGYLKDKASDPCPVMISREGKLIKATHGRHRFAAAQIVGLCVLPVTVIHIHREWLTRIHGGFRDEKLENLRTELYKIGQKYRSD